MSISSVEVLANEYMGYDNEPRHLIRFIDGGTKYLFGLEARESKGITAVRSLKGYSAPTQIQINEATSILEKGMVYESDNA